MKEGFEHVFSDIQADMVRIISLMQIINMMRFIRIQKKHRMI